MQKQRYSSGRPTLLIHFREKLNEDDDEVQVVPIGIGPRHELHFRQMPFIYKEFHETSISTTRHKLSMSSTLVNFCFAMFVCLLTE